MVAFDSGRVEADRVKERQEATQSQPGEEVGKVATIAPPGSDKNFSRSPPRRRMRHG